jgi:Calcineurin-like phosphoesterase
MAHYAAEKLGVIPAPTRDPTMNLKDIIGQPGVDEIQQAGVIKFHVVGDTGRPSGDAMPQEQVAEAMTVDYDPAAPKGHDPALLVHLGDVIYGHDKAQLYRDEFYRPYMKYPGKIIAIPGNHDGETFKGTDPVSLREFRNNFCAPRAVVPPIAADVRIFRETMTQPGVYWMLAAPFVNIIGLYSNIAEGPGNLLGAGGDDQQIKWLTKTLSALKQSGDKKALVIATHHPPYSSGGHSPSKDMLAQIDKVCNDTGVVPHAMLAGHAHNYQRYTRSTTLAGRPVHIAYIVAGCGGHAASAVTAASGQQMGETVFEKSLQGYGYLLMTASASQLTIEMIETTNGGKKPFDRVTIDLSGGAGRH